MRGQNDWFDLRGTWLLSCVCCSPPKATPLPPPPPSVNVVDMALRRSRSPRETDRQVQPGMARLMTPTITVLTQRIRREFDEAPGLQLTVAEGVRFWSLDVETCAD